MAEIYEHVDPVELTATLRLLPEPPNFRLNTFLPDQTTARTSYSINDLSHIVRTATFRSFDAPVAIGRRGGFTKRQGALPALGRGYVLGEYADLLRRQISGMDASEVVGGIEEDARRGVEEIRARMEVARGQVLATGKFTLTDEDGLTLEADFNIPDTQVDIAPSVAWTDPEADIVSFLRDLADLAEETSGVRPDVFIPGRNVVGHMTANEKLRNQYGNLFGAPTEIGVQQVNAVLAAREVPTVATTTNGQGQVRAFRPTKVEHDGTVVDTYPADKITLLPEVPVGRTLWGPTIEALELAQDGRLTLTDAPGVIALALKDANPAQITTVVNAVGLPIIEQPKRMVIATPLVAA